MPGASGKTGECTISTYQEWAPLIQHSVNPCGVIKSRIQLRPGRLLLSTRCGLPECTTVSKALTHACEVDLMVIISFQGEEWDFQNGMVSVGEEQEEQVCFTPEFLNQSCSLISKERLPIVSTGSYLLQQMKGNSRPYRPNMSGHAILAT